MRKYLFLMTLLCLMTTKSWAGTIPMQLVNNSQFADNEIYVAIIGKTNGKWIYYDLSNNNSGNVKLNTLSTSVNTLHKTSSDWGYANIFTTLDKISNKTINLVQTNSCRVFFGFRSKLYIHAFDDNKGFAGADFQNPSDPNHGIRWELMEFTLDENAIWVNTSRVDAFQYPMGVELYGGAGANNHYMKRGEIQDYSTIINRWNSTNGNNQFSACYQKNITTDNLGGIIVQPSKVASIKGNGYFNDYINRIWNYYSNNQLYADMGQLGRWRGRVSGSVFTLTRESDGAVAKIYSKPTTTDAIEGDGAFNRGNSLDLALQAMFCGAINRGVIDLRVASGQLQYWGDRSKFFNTDTYNPYVKFFHQPDLSYDGYIYAFAYDDTFDQSSTCATSHPDHCVVTIGGFKGTSGGNTGGDDVTVPAAPTPTKSAANVKSLYSDAYTSVASNWAIGQWNQSTTTVQKNLSGTDKAYYNTKFNYLGFNYGTNGQAVDMSGMDYMHLDIYPLSDMTINVYPITKYSNGTTNDTQKKAVNLTANKWNQVDLSVADFKALGLDMSTNFQIKLDGGNGANNFFLDNIYFWKEDASVNIPAAPAPTKSAANVKSLYSDAYTSVAPNWAIGQWYQSTITVQKDLSGTDKAYYNTKFNYLGFNYGTNGQAVDMSGMDYMHLDIYPLSDMTINVYPITKNSNGTTNDTQKKAVKLTANKWNQVDLSVADFKALGLDMSTNFQIKLDGGNGTNNFFLDNIYFWKEEASVNIPAAPKPTRNASDVKSLYSDAYTTVAQSWSIGKWWQSTKTSEVAIANGDKVYCNTNFNYLGFQYGSDSQVLDMSAMNYMHIDIYPTSDFTINIYPITRTNGVTNDTKKLSVPLTKNQWNSIDLNVEIMRGLGLDMSKCYQIKLDGGSGNETFYLDNIYFWKGVPAAPKPTVDAGNVKSLYSDAYNTVTANWAVGKWWQSTKTNEVALASGDNAYCNTSFNYLGFQFGGDNDVVDASNMKYLHVDIYPTQDMTINIYPISKYANGATNDKQKVTYLTLKDRWNSYDIKVDDLKNMGVDMSKNFQLKFDGGNGTQTFYLDNMYYWTDSSMRAKPSEVTDISGVDDESNATHQDVYTIDGRKVKHDATSLEGLQPGLYIVNGKKVVVR